MHLELDKGSISLEPRQSLRLPEALGARITCRRGCLWLTEHGCRDDIVLAPGDTHRLRRRGLALVYAMEPSELEIEMLETSTALHRRAGRERAALLADWLAALWRAGMKLAAWTARPRRSRAADAIHAA